MKNLEQAAITAIFHRQMSFRQALSFVVRETGVAVQQADQALRGVMTWYRKS